MNDTQATTDRPNIFVLSAHDKASAYIDDAMTGYDAFSYTELEGDAQAIAKEAAREYDEAWDPTNPRVAGSYATEEAAKVALDARVMEGGSMRHIVEITIEDLQAAIARLASEGDDR